MNSKTTVNQRFSDLLNFKKLDQQDFSKITGINDGTVSNIRNGKTKEPKASFFQSIAIHFPEINLRWLLLGEGTMLNDENEMRSLMEPHTLYKQTNNIELARLQKEVGQLLETNRQLSRLASSIPHLLHSIEQMQKRLDKLEST